MNSSFQDYRQIVLFIFSSNGYLLEGWSYTLLEQPICIKKEIKYLF